MSVKAGQAHFVTEPPDCVARSGVSGTAGVCEEVHDERPHPVGDSRQAATIRYVPYAVQPLGWGVYAEVCEASAPTIDQALKACTSVASSLEATARHERAQVLENLALAVDAQAESLARMLILEIGKTIRDARS